MYLFSTTLDIGIQILHHFLMSSEGAVYHHHHHHKHHDEATKSKSCEDIHEKEIEKLDPHIFFASVDPKLPVQSHQTEPAILDPKEISMIKECIMLSYHVYYKPKERKLPPEIGPIVYERTTTGIVKIPFFVANSDILNTIFVVCRGSYCIDDLITDLMGNAIRLNGGYMHQGVYETASYVFYHVQSIIIQLSKEYKDRPIIFTGHSLGAGVAAAVCEMIHKTHPEAPVRSIIFAPPPTVCHNLHPMTKERIETFVLDGDFVPFLSLENILNVTLDIVSSRIARYVRKKIEKRLKTTSHGAYEPGTSVQLYPPGEIYQFVLHNDDYDKIELVRIVSPDFFGRLVRGLREYQHLAGTYMKWIENYFHTHT